MARRKKGGDEGGGANWMDTYGDMITLILTFFVLLYSFSNIDKNKWDMLVETFTGGPALIMPLNPAEATIEQQIPELSENGNTEASLQEFDELYKNLSEYVQDNGLDPMIAVQKEDDFIMIRFDDSMLFDSGRAEIKPESIVVLQHVTNMLNVSRASIREVRVEGHTDSDPISTPEFPNNWFLASRRSYNVMEFVQGNSQLAPSQLIVASLGDTRPIASNDTEEGKMANRRVEFWVERIKSTQQ